MTTDPAKITSSARQMFCWTKGESIVLRVRDWNSGNRQSIIGASYVRIPALGLSVPEFDSRIGRRYASSSERMLPSGSLAPILHASRRKRIKQSVTRFARCTKASCRRFSFREQQVCHACHVVGIFRSCRGIQDTGSPNPAPIFGTLETTEGKIRELGDFYLNWMKNKTREFTRDLRRNFYLHSRRSL